VTELCLSGYIRGDEDNPNSCSGGPSVTDASRLLKQPQMFFATVRIWPNQDSGTWVIHHFKKPGDCDDISVSRILHFVQDVRLPNVSARGLHKRWIMVRVHGSLSACPAVFYSIQFYTHCTDNTMTFIIDV